MKKQTALILIPILILITASCTSFITGEKPSSYSLPAGPVSDDYEYAGNIDAGLRSWNWLFLKSSEERRSELERQAAELAADKYGDDAKIKTETVTGRWSPFSLVMLLGSLGYVEDAALTASVWLPVPPPPEPVVVEPLRIRYRIIPEREYNSDTEFFIIDYRDTEQLQNGLTEELAAGKISASDYQKKQAKLPDVGRLSVTLGRIELSNAISRWFTFTVKHNGITVLRKRGIEDIPYVYGNDKLWWNDLSYDIDSDWEGELQLQIEDSYQEKIYNYTIIKERF